ncbi:MAG TPA: efflux transporter outer membrane subunit [Caulobacteraceae bacterium]|jgi:multidrug efflux system outer membrane protein
MRRPAPPPIVLAALLLAGCIDLAPAYHRPAMPTPAKFPTGPAYPTPAVAPRPLVGWREFFSDPRLKAVIEQALANNRDLRIAMANIAAARAQYQVQRAALFPKIDANATATYGQEPLSVVSGGAIPAGASGTFNERLYSLTAGFTAWQLDLFGKVRDLTRAAQEQYFATREARDAAQITLVSEVAADYLTLGADRALLAIAQDTLTSSRDTLLVTQHRFDAGVASELDVSQAQTIAQQARFDVARLTTQVAQDRNALDLVVGAPVADEALPSGIGEPIVVLDNLPAAVDSSVLLARPDVLQAEDALRAANANIGAARANFFPSISLTASGGLTSLALSTLFKGSSATWSFVPSVSQTLFDAGANRGNLAFAKAQRDVGVATYEKAIQTAFREVADALALRGTIDEQLAAQQALTAASADFLNLSTARYERGADTYLNVLIAQRSLYAARQTLVASQLAKAANLVTLYTVLGGGLSAPATPPQR